jgi:hypothetical protein
MSPAVGRENDNLTERLFGRMLRLRAWLLVGGVSALLLAPAAVAMIVNGAGGGTGVTGRGGGGSTGGSMQRQACGTYTCSIVTAYWSSTCNSYGSTYYDGVYYTHQHSGHISSYDDYDGCTGDNCPSYVGDSGAYSEARPCCANADDSYAHVSSFMES